VLSEIGQEVEVEARIAVAPRGIVTRVEIVKGSGYIEIDASVADALRDYLFSPVDGRVDTIGTVTFRFRLEKQD
jgi:TonB family protein